MVGKGGFGSVSLVQHKNLEKLPNLTPNDSNNTVSKLSRPNVFAMKTKKKGKNYYSKAIDDKASKKYH